MTILERIQNYLESGGLFNPEMMEHEKVRELIMDCRSELQIITTQLERVVVDMSDSYKWNWTKMMSHRDAADAALLVLAREGLIEQVNHPSGGRIWRANGKLFGRTDDITCEKFDSLKRHNENL